VTLSNSCGGKLNSLVAARNTLITISKLTSDPQLKEDYKEARTELEEMLKESATTCPDMVKLNALLQYVNNEYSKYI